MTSLTRWSLFERPAKPSFWKRSSTSRMKAQCLRFHQNIHSQTSFTTRAAMLVLLTGALSRELIQTVFHSMVTYAGDQTGRKRPRIWRTLPKWRPAVNSIFINQTVVGYGLAVRPDTWLMGPAERKCDQKAKHQSSLHQKKIRCLMVADEIRYSRDIYISHHVRIGNLSNNSIQ